MSTTQELKIFDDKHIRTFWDDYESKRNKNHVDIYIGTYTDSRSGTRSTW